MCLGTPDFLVLQEWQAYKKFTDSLLARSGKISALLSTIDGYKHECEEGSADIKRIDKSQPHI